MTEKKSGAKRKNHTVLCRSGHCLYLCIRRKAFKAGNTLLIVEDRINLFLPWRSQRVLKIAGKRFLYSMVPLISFRHRLLCYNYCADVMAVHDPDFYQHALVLGCGGGALPRWLLEEYPALQVDVVDLSSEIISVCREYFLQKWENSGRLHYYCMDARDFEEREYPYQFIFCDLFDGTDLAATIYDKGFAGKLRALLSEGGILTVNCGWKSPDDLKELYGTVFGDRELTVKDSGQNRMLKAVRRDKQI